MILYGVAFKYLRALKIIMRIYLLFGFPSTYKRVTKKKKNERDMYNGRSSDSGGYKKTNIW